MKFADRRVALAMAALAIVAGGLAAWMVQREVAGAAGASGSPTPVLVAAVPIEAGESIDADKAAELASIVEIPASFAPPDVLVAVADVAGLRAIASIPAGGYLTRGAFSSDTIGGDHELRRGERAISIDASPSPDGVEPVPGSIVDLVASGVGGAPQSRVVIAGAEVLAASEAQAPASSRSASEGGSNGASIRLTVRVRTEQVPAVVRADVFAREIRAVIR